MENKELDKITLQLIKSVKKSIPMVNNRYAKRMLIEGITTWLKNYKKLGGDLNTV